MVGASPGCSRRAQQTLCALSSPPPPRGCARDRPAQLQGKLSFVHRPLYDGQSCWGRGLPSPLKSSPAALLPACCLTSLPRGSGQGGGCSCDGSAPVGSAASSYLPLFLHAVGRHLELFCLHADTLQDCGNGNRHALAALVFTLQTVSSFLPADLMPALPVLPAPRCG